MSRSPVVPVLITSLLVSGAVWAVLNTSSFRLTMPGASSVSGAQQVASNDSKQRPNPTAKDSPKSGKHNKGSGERSRSTLPTLLVEVDAVTLQPPPAPAIGRDSSVFPLASDIRPGMAGTEIRGKFGIPDAIATASENGLVELYVYQRKADGKLTTVRLRDGVVQR